MDARDIDHFFVWRWIRGIFNLKFGSMNFWRNKSRSRRELDFLETWKVIRFMTFLPWRMLFCEGRWSEDEDFWSPRYAVRYNVAQITCSNKFRQMFFNWQLTDNQIIYQIYLYYNFINVLHLVQCYALQSKDLGKISATRTSYYHLKIKLI